MRRWGCSVRLRAKERETNGLRIDLNVWCIYRDIYGDIYNLRCAPILPIGNLIVWWLGLLS